MKTKILHKDATLLPALLLLLPAALQAAETNEAEAKATKTARADSAQNAPLTQEQALQQAFAHSPMLQAAEAGLKVLRGQLRSAETYPYNPEIEGSAAARLGAAQPSLDVELGLSQELELAGQTGARQDSARAALRAAESNLLRQKRQLAASVQKAFAAVVASAALRDIAAQDDELTQKLYSLAQRRLSQGAGTSLDVNLAAAELGRARARLYASQAQEQTSSSALAQIMGWPTGEALPGVVVTHDQTWPEVPDLQDLLSRAQQQRSDLRSRRQQEQAARAQLGLARRQAWPNLQLRAFAGREASSENLFGGGLAIPIPLFNRKQGAIESGQARLTQRQAETEQARLAISQQIRASLGRYKAARQTLQDLQRLVMDSQQQNIELLQRAYEGGKVSWAETVIMRRSLVESQRQLVQARLDARRAWVDLQLASAALAVPQSSKNNTKSTED